MRFPKPQATNPEDGSRPMKQINFRVIEKLSDELELLLLRDPSLKKNDFLTEALIKHLQNPKTGLKGPELMALPIDTRCADKNCGKKLKLGEHAFYHPIFGTLCLECGTKRKWSTQSRVKQMLADMEAKLDRQAIKAETTAELLRYTELRELQSILALELRQLDLNKMRADLMTQGISYIQGVAEPEEKKALQKLIDTIATIEAEIQEIHKERDNRELLLAKLRKRIEKKKKKAKKKEPEIPA